MNIYTLAHPMNGEHGTNLNGKLLSIWVSNRTHEMLLLDVSLKFKPIWRTTEVLETQNTETGIIVKTKNTEYEFVNVLSLIPTSTINDATDDPEPDSSDENPDTSNEESVSEKEIDFKVVSERRIHRMINYCDGYDGSVYLFDRSITYAEFITFLKQVQGKKLETLTGYAWYQDHDEIEIPDSYIRDIKDDTSSKTWVYKWVRVYTD